MVELTLGRLPLLQVPLGMPFAGFALNLNVATQAHRDRRDACVCVVIPFGNFKGGQLCLYEPGLVFDLQLGNAIVFESRKITHFNLGFEGVRHSLVLHTDDSLRDDAQAFPRR